MSDKIEKFMSLLGSVWGKRHESEEAEANWLRMWANMLKPFEPWVLEAGIQRLVETRRDKFFPTVAEVRDLLVAIRAEERRSRPELTTPKPETVDSYAFADRLIWGDLGRTAAAAEPCWILALHDFARENHRLPAGVEINRCKQIAADFEERYRECVRGERSDGTVWPEARRWVQFAETMIRRREALRAKLIGRAAA